MGPDSESWLALHAKRGNLNCHFSQFVSKNVTFYKQSQTWENYIPWERIFHHEYEFEIVISKQGFVLSNQLVMSLFAWKYVPIILSLLSENESTILKNELR